jgi:replicative DNA helicase
MENRSTNENINSNRVDYITINDAIKQHQLSLLKDSSQSILSGFSRLDLIKKGWIPGELCIIGGRPGMGKTGFIFSLIRNMLNEKIPVSLFTASDTNNIRFITRLVSCIEDIKPCACVEDSLSNMHEVNHPLYLNFQSKLTLSYIRENAYILIQKYGVKCIFIETIQSIFNSECNGNTKEGMEQICNELKILARDLKVPLIITSELNRSVEHREGIDAQEPFIEDLRSSSAIESEADSIILYWRPAYYKIYCDEKGNELRDIAMVKIAKNQYGGIGDIRLKYDVDSGTVSCIDNEMINKMKLKEKLEANEPFRNQMNVF